MAAVLRVPPDVVRPPGAAPQSARSGGGERTPTGVRAPHPESIRTPSGMRHDWPALAGAPVPILLGVPVWGRRCCESAALLRAEGCCWERMLVVMSIECQQKVSTRHILQTQWGYKRMWSCEKRPHLQYQTHAHGRNGGRA